MKHRMIGVVLCTVVGTACQSPVESDDPGSVVFAYGVHRLQIEAPFLIAETNPLTIRGYLLTPCQPYNASASAAIEGDVLTLRVTARSAGPCRGVVTAVGYQAIVDAEESPVTQLRIVHEWRDSDWPAETVFQSSLSE